MSKTRDTGFLGNVVKYDANGNVTIVSGSTTLLNISSSGLLSVPNSEVITGSLTVLGGITGAITGSATSASYAANTSLLNGSGSGEFVPTGSFNTFSSSILSYTGSSNSRLGSLETTSGSNITRLSSLEAKTGSYATTGSNTFVDGQYLSSSFNPTGFSTTASLYTDGGLRVTKDAYISGTLYLNNVTVYGTQSVCYITSSQLNIASNLISVNTATPSVRFGGLAVYDSGSTGLTGSLLWDSQNNHWVYSNPSGSSYSGGMFISGPRTSTLGSETGTTSCMLLAGQGGDHLTSSMIYHDSTVTCIPTSIVGGSTACFGGSVTATGLSLSSASTPLLQITDTTNSKNLLMGVDDNNTFIRSSTSTPILFQVNGGDPSLTLASSGIACFANIVCTPRLEILRSSANNGLFVYSNSGATAIGCTMAQINGLTNDSTGNILTLASLNDGIRMVVRNDGNVGIGTNSPSQKLTVTGIINAEENGSYYGAWIQGSCTAGKCSTLGLGVWYSQAGYIQWVDNDRLRIYTCSSSRSVTLQETGGNVGIGTSSPVNILHVKSGTSGLASYDSRYKIVLENNGEAYYAVTVPDNSYAGMRILGTASEARAAFEYYMTENLLHVYSACSARFHMGGSERMRITSTGITCFACTVCAPQLRAGSSGITTTGNLFWNTGDGTDWYIQGQANGPTIRMKYDGGTTNRSGALGWVDNSGGRYEALSWQDSNVYIRTGCAHYLYLPATTGVTPLQVAQNQSCGGYLRVAGDHRIANGDTAMFEYVGTVPAGGNACVLVIPVRSQGNLHTRSTFEIHGISAEYNLNGTIRPFGGIIAIESLNNVNVIQAFNLYGTLCGVAASANCIRLSFNTQYNSGASCGVTLRIKLLTTLAWDNYFNVMSMQ